LGLARDLIIAHYFGTSMMADAFNLAYQFTGNFFVILGGVGGPFYTSIVSTLPKIINEHHQHSPKFIAAIIWRTLLMCLVLSLAFFLIQKPLLSLYIDKTTHREYYDLTLFNLNLLLPLFMICGPIGLIAGILNCYKRYIWPTLSPAVINIILIAMVLAMGDTHSGIALALGSSIGGVLSLLVQLPGLKKITDEVAHGNESVQGSFDIKKLIKDYDYLLYPALFSSVASQLIVFVDSFFCKSLETGSWTALTLGNRIIQMPLGVLLTAFLVPIFPRIAELIAKHDISKTKQILIKASSILIVICIPGTIVGLLYSETLIRTVFEHGAFDANSTRLLSTVFYYLCFSIIPYALRDTLTRTLYCFGDSKTALILTCLAVALKFPLNYYLVDRMGLAGLALSTTVITIINAVILYFVVSARFKNYAKPVDA